MDNCLKLGIIGTSPGNGHPYSWSAIFNGFDKEKMAYCPFPVINKYLNSQNFPDDLLNTGKVTHIWTQDKNTSREIAKTTFIPNIVNNRLDLIDQVDAILLARDDAENHFIQSKEFIELGIPIFIDKPLALKVKDAEAIFKNVSDFSKIFTCSGLSYSPQLINFSSFIKTKGDIISIEGKIRGSWDTYSIHLIEPILKYFVNWNQKFLSIHKNITNEKSELYLKSQDNIYIKFITDKSYKGKPSFKINTKKGEFIHFYEDTFNAFKESLNTFTKVIKNKIIPLDKDFILKTIHLLECGKSLET